MSHKFEVSLSVRRVLIAFGLAVCLSVGAAAQARAAFSITGASLQPASDGAGTHPNVTLQTSVTPFGDTSSPRLRDLVVHLPAGLIGNPAATAARCSETDFQADRCPAASRVGSVTVGATAIVLLLPTPITADGDVYNLQPGPGEPARLGTVVRPFGGVLGTLSVPVQVRLRPSDGGLDTTISNLPRQVIGFETWVTSLSLILDGTVGGRPFMTLPTSCTPARTTIEATADDNTRSTVTTAPFTPTNCAAVPFTPSASVQVDPSRRGAPSQYTVALNVPAGETPVRQSHVRRAEVVLPEGTTLSPGVASGGLAACAAAPCPAASNIGKVKFDTPLLGSLDGNVYLATPTPARPLGLIVTVDDPRVPLVLTGAVSANPSTGQLTTVFDNLPQVPFTRFALTFNGGAHAVLSNPARCGTHTATVTLTPWSGNAPAVLRPTFATDENGAGAPCAAAIPFRPGLAVSAQSTRAGQPAGALTLTITRPDGDQDLGRLQTDLPPGLAGSIAGVPLCGEAAANAGTCPAESRVGGVSALVGPGPAPVRLTGSVYLTGPAEGGLVGLSIVIPGRVGPIDLGTVVTRAGIALRGDGGLTVRTGALPPIVGGVPVSIRELALTLDRPGFVVNPTDCAALNVHATFSSADGATATADAPYQATSCELLPFAPRISATVGAVGKTRRNAKPPVTTVLTTPPGHAVIRRAVVKLPSAVTVDLAALRTLCIGADLASGNCPEGSKVGTAEARSPLLPVPLTGDVVLAKTDPAALPGLTVLLRSPVALRLDGTFDLGSQSSTFDNIPDVPLSRFELRFLPNRVLKLFRDLCTSARVTVEAQFTGHNGKTASDRENVQRIGCAPALRATLKLGHLGVRHPSLALTVRPGKGGAPLQRLQFRLPGSLRAHPRAGDRAGRADGRRIKGLRLSRAGVVTVTLGRSGARKITLRLGRGAFTPTRALMRRLRKHPRLTFTLAATDRGHNRAERTLKVRARR